MAGLGSVGYWGFSAPLNLLKSVGETSCTEDVDSVKLLLVCPLDITHVLHTLVQYEAAHPLHFYLVEKEPETMARHLLLLHLVWNEDCGLRETARTFLDVAANLHVSSSSLDFVSRASSEVENFMMLEDEGKWLDTSLMTYRDMDGLTEALDKWSRSSTSSSQGHDLWNKRLRELWESRYDSRKNLFDWDYHMRAGEALQKKVCKKDYLAWRETGQAFLFTGKCQNLFNPTLMSVRDSEQGYFGDINIGPYMAYAENLDTGANLEQWIELISKIQTKKKDGLTIKILPLIAAKKGSFKCSCLTEIVKVMYVGCTGVNLVLDKDYVTNTVVEGGRVVVESVAAIHEMNVDRKNAYMKTIQDNFFKKNWLEEPSNDGGLQFIKIVSE